MKKYIFIMLAIGLPLFIVLPAGADRDDGGDDNGQYFNSFGEDGGNDDFQQPDDGDNGDNEGLFRQGAKPGLRISKSGFTPAGLQETTSGAVFRSIPLW